MGCDIHAVWQTRDPNSSIPAWVNLGLTSIRRDYLLFFVLAGVRRVSNVRYSPIAVERGLPADYEVPHWDDEGNDRSPPDISDRDQHSHSWLTGEEMMTWYATSSPHAHDLAYFFDEVARLIARHGEIRFVFAFDN